MRRLGTRKQQNADPRVVFIYVYICYDVCAKLHTKRYITHLHSYRAGRETLPTVLVCIQDIKHRSKQDKNNLRTIRYI